MLSKLIPRSLLALSILLLTGLFCLSPVQAAVNSNSNPVDSTLEAEVLQIIRQHPEVLIESVQAYQKQQQEQQKQFQQSFLLQLKTDPQSIIAESPTLGNLDQKKVLLEFSDFQCPYCGQAHETLNEFMDIHQDEVTLVYKYFPLSNIHPQAIAASKASWAAAQQGEFWPYYDALFNQQDKLSEEFYLDIANSLDLDIEQFNRDRNSKQAILTIEKDMKLAQQIGIQGTPFFVFNGQFFSGSIPLSTLEEALSR